MAEYIDSNTLSKLRAISILEVADELGMGLRYHNALCISHNDTHPSLHFWTSTNTCHCFACGWGGDCDGALFECASGVGTDVENICEK